MRAPPSHEANSLNRSSSLTSRTPTGEYSEPVFQSRRGKHEHRRADHPRSRNRIARADVARAFSGRLKNMADHFAYWRLALHAKENHLLIPRERYNDGTPQKAECGYYRKRIPKRGNTCWEAVAFYPQPGGTILCERQFG